MAIFLFWPSPDHSSGRSPASLRQASGKPPAGLRQNSSKFALFSDDLCQKSGFLPLFDPFGGRLRRPESSPPAGEESQEIATRSAGTMSIRLRKASRADSCRRRCNASSCSSSTRASGIRRCPSCLAHPDTRASRRRPKKNPLAAAGGLALSPIARPLRRRRTT